MNSKLTVDQIKKRALSAFMSLAVRQVALRAIGFISINLILAKLLSVQTLGIFNIATSIITFFSFFSDIGLAASLIQKKDEIKREDITTTFTIQQILVGILSIAIILGAPLLGSFYQLDDSGIWLVRILGISFFLSSLKVIPSVLLERELKFKPLVTVELVETIVFNVVLIVLAYRGMDIWSFSVAALLRGVIGVVLIYSLAPTRIGFGIKKEVAAQLLSYGIPYQANSLLALVKDRLVPLVVARMVGATGIGYVTWAQAMAFLPLEAMNIIIRITFPAFSRMQDDKESLGKAVEKSLFATTIAVFPALFGIGALLPSVVLYVVSSKWQPALSSFYFFAFSTFWASMSTTFTNVLNAIGYVKITLRLMILWTVLTWVLTPLLVLTFGFLGVAIASFIISFTSVLTIIIVKRILVIRVMEAIKLPLFASIIMAVVVYWFSVAFVRDRLTLAVAVVLGVVIYAGVIMALGRNKVLAEIRSLKNV